MASQQKRLTASTTSALQSSLRTQQSHQLSQYETQLNESLLICESLQKEKTDLLNNLKVLFEQNKELQQDVQILSRALQLKEQETNQEKDALLQRIEELEASLAKKDRNEEKQRQEFQAERDQTKEAQAKQEKLVKQLQKQQADLVK